MKQKENKMGLATIVTSSNFQNEDACAGVKRVDLPRVVWSDGCATRPAS
jgi:hypothetical protein